MNRAVAAVAAAVLAVTVLFALAGPLIAPYPAGAQDIALGASGPSVAHWLGTDDFGRDILSRLIAGASSAMLWPVFIAVGSTAISCTLGLISGYRGGWGDALMMRGVDLVIALPGMLVLIVLVGMLGGGVFWSVVALTVLFVPGDIRVIRSLTMAQRELAYVEAAQTMGLRPSTIMFRHILPNILPTVISGLLLGFVAALVALAGLSFLGLGLPSGTPDWGLMVEENRRLLDVNPWAAVGPAMLITVVATAATLLGDRIFELMSGTEKQA